MTQLNIFRCDSGNNEKYKCSGTGKNHEKMFSYFIFFFQKADFLNFYRFLQKNDKFRGLFSRDFFSVNWWCTDRCMEIYPEITWTYFENWSIFSKPLCTTLTLLILSVSIVVASWRYNYDWCISVRNNWAP